MCDVLVAVMQSDSEESVSEWNEREEHIRNDTESVDTTCSDLSTDGPSDDEFIPFASALSSQLAMTQPPSTVRVPSLLHIAAKSLSNAIKMGELPPGQQTQVLPAEMLEILLEHSIRAQGLTAQMLLTLQGKLRPVALPLTGKTITNEHIRILQTGFRELQSLSLNRSQITGKLFSSVTFADIGLTALRGCISLTHLDLGHTAITDAALDTIAQLPCAQIISFLYVT
eukprot:TRINITY_DN187_c0_g1_i7.p1 TRINITY_DN187_c0_g1~~TRINITY_DN187_c0_g1_i7.p1  ORF type:complete len:227 (+),score=35.36 TRINITY_DN187_c0_g1_i7:237-917(+)